MRSYLQFARKLFTVIGAEWLPFFSEQDREDCFDVFFVGGSSINASHPHSSKSPSIRVAALTALAAALGWCQDAFTLQHVVRLLKVSTTCTVNKKYENDKTYLIETALTS